MLVRHAATPTTRKAAFPVDELLDPAGMEQARSLAPSMPKAIDVALSSGSARARQMASVLGLDVEIRPALDECDFGSWAGRTMQDVAAEDAEAFAAWCKDPMAAPHGGECLEDLFVRMRSFLGDVAGLEGTTVAVTSGGPIKACVAIALDAPVDAFWRIDAAPASITELHLVDGSWRCTRVNWTAS
ncbi:MAG: histidine phosphatase family protein [Thermoleophilaceae bacterium]